MKHPVKSIAWCLLLGVLLLAYVPVMVELVKDWVRDPNYAHGFLIPPISAYLIWSRRVELKGLRRSPSYAGLAGLVVAAVMLILGTAGAEVFTQRVSLIVLLASLVLFLYGKPHLRILAFPIAFFFLAIPLPYVIYYDLTAPMQLLAARCAAWGLRSLGVQAVVQGNIIHLPNTSLEVANACSGIRSLYAFLAVGALVAYSTTVPLWGRLVIFLSTVPLSVAGNAFRVWGSGMGAWLIGPEAAKGTVHEVFGLVVFIVCLGMFLLFRKGVRHLWSPGSSPPSSSSVSPEPMPPIFAPNDRFK